MSPRARLSVRCRGDEEGDDGGSFDDKHLDIMSLLILSGGIEALFQRLPNSQGPCGFLPLHPFDGGIDIMLSSLIPQYLSEDPRWSDIFRTTTDLIAS